jgi:hypothetical protein
MSDASVVNLDQAMDLHETTYRDENSKEKGSNNTERGGEQLMS